MLPRLAEAHAGATAKDLMKLPLLHLASRPDQWRRRFAAQGEDGGMVQGMVFDQFATAAQAAWSGLGIALLPTFLCADEIKRGNLVPIVDAPMSSHQRYWLVWPDDCEMGPPLRAFRGWLLGASRREIGGR